MKGVDGASEWKMWIVVVIVVVGCVCGFWMRIRMVDIDVDADEGRKGGGVYIGPDASEGDPSEVLPYCVPSVTDTCEFSAHISPPDSFVMDN